MKISLSTLSNLFAIYYTISFCLIVIPVLNSKTAGFGPSPYKDWYGVNDLLRLWEPFFSSPFQLFIFYAGSQYLPISYLNMAWFAFANALYQQGAGFHSGAILFKNSLESLTWTNPSVTGDIYFWTRTTWEHAISHYSYALGGVLFALLYATSSPRLNMAMT